MSPDPIKLPPVIPAGIKNPTNYLRGYNGANRCRISRERLEQAARVLQRSRP